MVEYTNHRKVIKFTREKDFTMKALVLQGIKDLAVQDYEVPEIKPDEVLVHTAFAGICGTDKALYAGLPGSTHCLRSRKLRGRCQGWRKRH